MSPSEARRHAAHLCDVYTSDQGDIIYGIHIGVIERLSSDARVARVSGHPECGDRNIPVRYLDTSCKITD